MNLFMLSNSRASDEAFATGGAGKWPISSMQPSVKLVAGLVWE